MDSRQILCCQTFVFHNTKLNEHENPVQRGLAYTPSQMLRMTEQGRPVSSQNIPEDMWSDTDYTHNSDFSLNPSEMRGSTMSACWEVQQDARKAFRKAKKDGAFKKPSPEGGES